MKFLTNEPSAPWWWKRAETASIFLFTSAIPILSLIEGMNETVRLNLTQVFLPLIILGIKTAGMVMGDSVAKPVNTEQKQELRAAETELQQKWTDEKQANKPE
jgi:hypothetical protein